MHISVIRKELLAFLRNRPYSTRSFKPILACVLLSAKGKQEIKIGSTDLECYLQVDLPGTVLKPGAVLVNGKALLDCIKTSKEKEVSLEAVTDGVCVRMNNAELLLPLESVDEFPTFPENSYDSQATVTAEQFHHLGRVSFATGDDGRFIQNAVKFEIGHKSPILSESIHQGPLANQESMILAVATNGRIMAVAECLASDAIPGSAFISAKHLETVLKSVPKSGIVSLRYNQRPESLPPTPETALPNAPDYTGIVIEWSGGKFYTRQLEGRFPPWQFFATALKNSCPIDGKSMVASAKAIAGARHPEFPSVKLTIGETIEFSTRGSKVNVICQEATYLTPFEIDIDPDFLTSKGIFGACKLWYESKKDYVSFEGPGWLYVVSGMKKA